MVSFTGHLIITLERQNMYCLQIYPPLQRGCIFMQYVWSNNLLMYAILSMIFLIKILVYLEDLIFYQLLMFTLMVPLISKSNNVFHEGNWGTKASTQYSVRIKKRKETLSYLLHNEIRSTCRSTPQVSHLKWLKCERRTVKVLMGNQLVIGLHTGLSLIPEPLSSLTQCSLSCLQQLLASTSTQPCH